MGCRAYVLCKDTSDFACWQDEEDAKELDSEKESSSSSSSDEAEDDDDDDDDASEEPDSGDDGQPRHIAY